MFGHDNDIALTKKDIKILLTKELGISIQEQQLRILVDALDKNNNEIISWQDFHEFTGRDRRGMRGYASKQQLNQWCLWLTTCRLTGMPNAYRFSSPILEKGEQACSSKASRQQLQMENNKSSQVIDTRCKNEGKQCMVSKAFRIFNNNS